MSRARGTDTGEHRLHDRRWILGPLLLAQLQLALAAMAVAFEVRTVFTTRRRTCLVAEEAVRRFYVEREQAIELRSVVFDEC